jgi:hypothetical protein
MSIGGTYGMGNPQVIISMSGTLAFTSMTFKGENQIMIFLATKSIAESTERTIQWA